MPRLTKARLASPFDTQINGIRLQLVYYINPNNEEYQQASMDKVDLQCPKIGKYCKLKQISRSEESLRIDHIHNEMSHTSSDPESDKIQYINFLCYS